VIQLRVRINGKDHFINRLGKYNDRIAFAKAQSLSQKIWLDYQMGNLDLSLESYRPVDPNIADASLLELLSDLLAVTGHGQVRHTMRLVEQYQRPLRTHDEVAGFLAWMETKGIAPVTRLGVLSTMRRVQPQNVGLKGHKIKVPPRTIATDIFSRSEVDAILKYLVDNDPWYFPVFATWFSTGMRNSELIGLTWDSIEFEDGRIKVTKSLKRIAGVTTRRRWSGTKNGKHRYIPMSRMLMSVLTGHQCEMIERGLYHRQGLVFLTRRTHSNLYDLLLERVWKRTLQAVGVPYRKLYSQRHTFLSHTLAQGNSPADVAQIAGHRVDELLKTYSHPTGNIKMVEW
jgi:integrase